MMQGIISRMATCSMECKKWCIAIVSLLIGLFSNSFDWMACACAICVCLAFLFIDAGYLAMERNFRKLQNTFVEKMNRGEQIDMDVFVTKDSSRHDLCKVLKAMMSGYTCFVYLLLVSLLLVYKYNS